MERMCTKCGIAKELDVVTIARIEGTIQAQTEAWKIEMAVVDNRQRRFV